MKLDEKWKPVNGYEGYYEVSDKGRVRSLDRQFKRPQNIGNTNIKGQNLKPSVHSSGYLRVNLCVGSVMKSHYVHVLVMESFNGPRPNRQDVDHVDRNRKNNRLKNLRWSSYKDNRGLSGFSNPNKKINKLKRQINGRSK